MKLLKLIIPIVCLCLVQVCFAEEVKWEKGGPKFLYVKPTKKPPHHGVYDETMKCVDCHSYDGVDAYTSATMAMKKSVKGAMPKKEIQEAIAEALKGKGDYREIYVLSTSFNNKPLASVIELVLDPATCTFYAMSERQTEKLFQIASNPNVSAAYVKQRENYDYFGGALGVQIVGTAKLLHDDDPEFVEAAKKYLPTLPPVPTGVQPIPIDDMVNMIKHSKIITKITPQRMVILNRSFKAKGFHAVQVWEADKK